MKYLKKVQRLLDSCDSDSWDIEANEELRLAWREEVEGNFCQIYKDLLTMEALLIGNLQGFQSLEDNAGACAERLRRALQ